MADKRDWCFKITRPVHEHNTKSEIDMNKDLQKERDIMLVMRKVLTSIVREVTPNIKGCSIPFLIRRFRIYATVWV